MNAMKHEELAVLPEKTTMYVISRKISRSGMRQVFDVFYVDPSAPIGTSAARWVRVSSDESKDFHSHATCHASTSIDQDRKLGGTFYVNGCGFNRAAEVVESLSIWATGKHDYFTCQMI